MDFDLSSPVRAIFALVLVVGLIGLVVWLVRRFSGERLGSATARGRQPRLAVIDAAAVDGRRRLVLIRRDNVEHLLMIGGPTDVVVELNIVRAAAAVREPQPVRPPAAADPLPRPVPLGEGSMWPLQPEPAPRPESGARIEPVARAEPPPRPHRATPPPLVEDPAQWSEPEPPAPAPPPPQRERRMRGADPLAGLAEELARAPVTPDPGSGEQQPVRQPPRREPRPAAARAGSCAGRRSRGRRLRRPEPRRDGAAAGGRVAPSPQERGRTYRARPQCGRSPPRRRRRIMCRSPRLRRRVRQCRLSRRAPRVASRAQDAPAAASRHRSKVALRQPRAGDGELAGSSLRQAVTALRPTGSPPGPASCRSSCPAEGRGTRRAHSRCRRRRARDT